jgi:glucose/arabinose dehydrogenase
MLKRMIVLLGTLAVVIGMGRGASAARVAAVVPPGFEDTLVTAVSAPTALAFVSPTRLLITSQTGQLWVSLNGPVLATPALNLSGVICSNSERGLLGVAVDPDFTSNHYIYLYYTFNKFNTCPTNQPTRSDVPVNRVSRFVLPDSNVIDKATETVLVDNILSPNGNHNGGDLHFGADGYLYISVGDGGADYAGDSGAGGANDATRDQFMLLGKILRITRDGGIPPSNPFQGAGTARCNADGKTSAGNKCQETYAWGLRNPFRFGFRPGTSEFMINDVGQGAWEEIDQGQSGADYGWNCREGKHTNSTTGKCSPAPSNMVDPIYDYSHTSGCNAITGGAFVPAGAWPAEYDGAYLFADYGCGKISKLTSSAGQYSAANFITGMGTNSATALLFGPYNGTQALYYASYAGGGQIRRIAYTAPVNPNLTPVQYLPVVRR